MPSTSPTLQRRGRKPHVIDPQRIAKLVEIGADNNEIAAACGVSIRTFYTHLAKSPEMQDAVQEGRHREAEFIMGTAQAKAAEGHWPAIRLLMARRSGFCDGTGINAIRQPSINRIFKDVHARLRVLEL